MLNHLAILSTVLLVVAQMVFAIFFRLVLHRLDRNVMSNATDSTPTHVLMASEWARVLVVHAALRVLPVFNVLVAVASSLAILLARTESSV